MNTISKDNFPEDNNSLESLNDSLAFKSDIDKLDFETEMINLDIVNLIQTAMEETGITKTELAKRLNMNKSHITQIFTADKILNLKFLAKVQRACEIKFNFTITPKYAVTPIHSIERYREKYENSHPWPNKDNQECVVIDLNSSNKKMLFA